MNPPSTRVSSPTAFCSSLNRAFRCAVPMELTTTNRIPATASAPTSPMTHGRRYSGGLRTTRTGRGGAAIVRPPLVLPLPLIAMRVEPLLLQQEPGDQDRKFVEDYQGHHHGRHGEPVLAGCDDRREDRDPQDGVPPVGPQPRAGRHPDPHQPY